MVLYFYIVLLAGIWGQVQGDTTAGEGQFMQSPFDSLDAIQGLQDDFPGFTELSVEEISATAMQNGNNIIYIQDRWKFRAGDNMDWAGSDYDDTEWEVISTNLTEADLTFTGWGGIGWFRRQFNVAPELRGKPIALLIERHLGASEIYLNGEKIYELGNFSSNPAQVQSYQSGKPLLIVFPERELHTLAVRFINPEYSETARILGYSGFRFLLGDWETHQAGKFSFLSEWTGRNVFFIGILAAFAVIHFFLFLFYPVEKRNLYFSLFAGVLAVLWYLFYKIELSELTLQAVTLQRFMYVTEVAVLVLAACFTHSITQNKISVYTRILLTAGGVVAFFVWLFPAELVLLREIAILFFALEIIRALGVMFYRNRKGVWVIGTGVLVFVITLVYSAMINVDFMAGNSLYANMLGSATLIFSMSVFLSRDFATTQKKLEFKLREVQILSKKSLEQERINKKREIEQRLLEAENKRKTKELEEARALQLSMLPQKLPDLPDYDIAVFMEAATEVGGDYYDYSLEKDGTLILAVGDATGHGMKAGIMVAAAKSYFHTLVHTTDTLSLLQKMSAGLRNMNMRMMYMGLTVVQCRGNEVELAAAGMPPALHFSKSRQKISRITLKGLPLGSQVAFPYKKEQVRLGKGDVLLLMSDGLTELFDGNRNMLGLERVEETLLKSSGMCAEKIVNRLLHLIEEWSGDTDPHDDITIMALKIPEL